MIQASFVEHDLCSQRNVGRPTYRSCHGSLIKTGTLSSNEILENRPWDSLTLHLSICVILTLRNQPKLK